MDGDFDLPSPVLTHMDQVVTVSSQLSSADRGQNGQVETGTGVSGSRWRDTDRYGTRSSSAPYLYSSSRYPSGRFGFLWVREPRVEVFVNCFLFWMDTTEMVRVAEEPSIYYSNWIFPIHIMAYLSTLRLIVTPSSPLLGCLGVLSQDLPFLVIRICLVAVFGYVTPLLYIMKNLLVCLTYIYFIFLTKLKVFNRTSMF